VHKAVLCISAIYSDLRSRTARRHARRHVARSIPRTLKTAHRYSCERRWNIFLGRLFRRSTTAKSDYRYRRPTSLAWPVLVISHTWWSATHAPIVPSAQWFHLNNMRDTIARAMHATWIKAPVFPRFVNQRLIAHCARRELPLNALQRWLAESILKRVFETRVARSVSREAERRRARRMKRKSFGA